MILQLHSDTKDARVFKGVEMIAELPSCSTKGQVERKTKLLGLKKMGRWKRTDWGFEGEVKPNK